MSIKISVMGWDGKERNFSLAMGQVVSMDVYCGTAMANDGKYINWVGEKTIVNSSGYPVIIG